jgi:hypothetical protein
VGISPQECRWSRAEGTPGHALDITVSPLTGHFHILVGWGPIDDCSCASRIAALADGIHSRVEAPAQLAAKS